MAKLKQIDPSRGGGYQCHERESAGPFEPNCKIKYGGVPARLATLLDEKRRGNSR
jgi:hypothetical protein